VGSDPVWDINRLLARIGDVAKVIAAAKGSPRVEEDRKRFATSRPTVEAWVKKRGSSGVK
jgi:hypothetical protein